MASKVRTLLGYSIVAEIPRARVRTLSGYAIERDFSKYNFSQTGTQRLTALIQSQSKIASLITQYDQGLPAATTGAARNSTITLTAKPASYYVGTAQVYFDRWPLAIALTQGEALKITVSTNTTLHELIPAINTAYARAFETIDFVDYAVSSGATTLTLTTTSTSLMWLPGETVMLGV